MLLLCLGAYLACGIWVSYFYPQVRTFQVQAEGLEAGVRLAVLSDLHDRRFGGDNAGLVRLVEGQSPDLILLAGDILNGRIPCWSWRRPSPRPRRCTSPGATTSWTIWPPAPPT